jgi:hypothetical protein
MQLEEFWSLYLEEHTHPHNRLLHFFGTSLSLGLIIAWFIRPSWSLFFLAIIVGYAAAWFGHFMIEKNKPASFKHPFYSFVCDWRMWFLMLIGRLDDEMQKLNISNRIS